MSRRTEDAERAVELALEDLFRAVEGNARAAVSGYLTVDQAAAAVRHAKTVLKAEEMLASGTATVQLVRRYNVTFWRDADGNWRIEEIEGYPADECQMFAVVNGEDFDEWFPFLPGDIGEEIHNLDIEIKIAEPPMPEWYGQMEAEKEDLSSP